ncbi:MAG: hypothetical protein JOY60_10915 [Burkholderiaceae bacterium]|nr:hypothetical protein [Burkholderiaceae bacterium]
MDEIELSRLIRQLYDIVRQLEAMFPGRHFTPDGHLVGSLGEAIASHYYGVELCTASTEGYDGHAGTRRVEVKTTQGKSVPLSSCPPHLLVFKLRPDGSFEECYNGPGTLAWELVAHGKLPKNGQRQVSLSALKKVMSEKVKRTDLLEPCRPFPAGTTRNPAISG